MLNIIFKYKWLLFYMYKILNLLLLSTISIKDLAWQWDGFNFQMRLAIAMRWL